MTLLFDIGFAPIQKRLRAGLQYIGSKEMIAPNILQTIAKYQPNATHAFDLFGGGGSMSLAMVASGLTTTYNELKADMPQIYAYVLECVKVPRHSWGIFDTEVYELCDRAEYKRIYNQYREDPSKLSVKELMWRYTWSFNCQGTTYFTDEQKSEFGYACHKIVMHPYLNCDYREAVESLTTYLATTHNADADIIRRLILETCEQPSFLKVGLYDRRLFYRAFLYVLEAFCVAGMIGEAREWSARRLASYSQSKLLQQIKDTRPDLASQETQVLADVAGMVGICQLCGLLERLARFERVEGLRAALRQHPLTITNNSYADFNLKEITERMGIPPQDTVVYCFDKETEIYTDSGWKYLKDCNKRDKFMSRHPENGTIGYKKATHFIKKHHTGKVLHYKSRRTPLMVLPNRSVINLDPVSIDLMVTPEHRLFVSKLLFPCRSGALITSEFIDAQDIEKLVGDYYFAGQANCYYKISPKRIKWVDYNDEVYCVRLEEWHTVLVKRGLNTPIWCGQCDIPYADSPEINSQVYATDFDIESFKSWTREQNNNGFNVFLSEYRSPDPELFKEVGKWQKISATTKGERVRWEKLFMASATTEVSK